MKPSLAYSLAFLWAALAISYAEVLNPISGATITDDGADGIPDSIQTSTDSPPRGIAGWIEAQYHGTEPYQKKAIFIFDLASFDSNPTTYVLLTIGYANAASTSFQITGFPSGTADAVLGDFAEAGDSFGGPQAVSSGLGIALWDITAGINAALAQGTLFYKVRVERSTVSTSNPNGTFTLNKLEAFYKPTSARVNKVTNGFYVAADPARLNRTYTIQRSTDLKEWKDWYSAKAFYSFIGQHDFEGGDKRFYRVVEQ